MYSDLVRERSPPVEIMILRAKVLFLTGQLQEALEQAEIACQASPDSDDSTRIRNRIREVKQLQVNGIAQCAAERWTQALDEWSRALQVP